MADIPILPTLLRELRLTQIAAHWQNTACQALAEGWPPSHFLTTLCELELAHRETTRLKRYLQESKLPAGKTLHSFNLPLLPSLNGAQVGQLCHSRDWLDEGHNVLIFGPSGVGKTHLAAAIVDGVVRQGIRARFYSATALVQELQVAKKALKLNQMLMKLDRYRLLVIDDLGYVKRDSTETSVLFELIAYRYERASLVVTANQPFSAWEEVFSDRLMTVAAVDRLVHHAYLFELQGESYRKKNAINNRKHLIA